MQDLEISAVMLSDDTHFGVAPCDTLPVIVTLAESCGITVFFGPQALGPLGATLTISSNDAAHPNRVVHLSGVGAGDTDGLENGVESGPAGIDPNYDGNGDGTPDSQQSHVASLPSYDAQYYVTLSSNAANLSLRAVAAVGNPSPANQPADAQFPAGFYEFTVCCLDSPGDSLSVTLYLAAGTLLPDTYYKFGPTPDNPLPHWYEFLFDGTTGAEINGSTIVLHFVDGARGDDDLLANRSVTDIGAPGVLGVNLAPLVDAGTDAVIEEGAIFAGPGSFTDADSSAWTATVDYGDGTGTQTFALESDGTFALSHGYADDGLYSVTVTVTDDAGSAGNDVALVTVSNVPPAVDVGADVTLAEGERFARAGSFSDPGADTWNATVDYGDGSGVQPLALDATVFGLDHVYADAGVYALTVALNDDDGGVGIDTASVTVEAAAPALCRVDADDDDDVDLLDIQHIMAARNQPVSGADDPRDADGDGVITVLDARQCVLACDRPRCAIN